MFIILDLDVPSEDPTDSLSTLRSRIDNLKKCNRKVSSLKFYLVVKVYWKLVASE